MKHPIRILGFSLAIALFAAAPPTACAEEIAFKIPADWNAKADLEAVGQKLVFPENFAVAGSESEGFAGFVLTAMAFGLLTLLTPCVFPMIPITVSYFIKQGEKKGAHPLALATVYALTIVAVLGIAAVQLLDKFRLLAVSPSMNVALGCLFVAFAFSLFGMFDLVLPGFLLRATSSQEGRGGYLGTIFMALSFSIVSFTCVAPFMGGFASIQASGKISNLQLYCGALAFAGTFAAPFFLLAIFPSLLKKLPKSGSWMTTIKVAMGFLELAASLKFFRTAELGWLSPPVYFTFDLVLSIWVGLLIAAGLYLLGLYRLPHDYPQEHIGVTRLMFALGCFGLAAHLLPALFPAAMKGRYRPQGEIYAWVDSFLLPDVDPGVSGDLRKSLDEAQKAKSLVFVDFTGVTCTNCRLNEKNVFPKPAIAELFKKYRTVQMYTDDVPESLYEVPPSAERRATDAEAVAEFQKKNFKDSRLPLYAILKPLPDGRIRVLGVYGESKINDPAAFEKFLAEPLQAGEK